MSNSLSLVTAPVFSAIQQVWQLYAKYITDRTVYDPKVQLQLLFEGENGVITILRRLTNLTPAQTGTIAAYTRTMGILILLANGYATDPLNEAFHIYLDLLVACKADDKYSTIFTSHFRELGAYLMHLLGSATDPNLALEISASCRALTQEVNLPYRYPLVA